MTNKPNLSDRPNGSLSVRLSYEVEMGGLEPIHKLERERNLVGEVADLERQMEAAEQKARRNRGFAEFYRNIAVNIKSAMRSMLMTDPRLLPNPDICACTHTDMEHANGPCNVPWCPCRNFVWAGGATLAREEKQDDQV